MPTSSPILENFNTGELSPLIGGRVGFEKYPNGASLLENFLPTTQGPLVRRGGFRFVNEVKDSNKRTLLVPFEFSVEQAYMLEFGDFYVRFFTWDSVTKVRGILESSPGVPVELVTPYSEDDLYNADGTPRLRFTQSGDFLYLVHSLYQQRILKRLTATSFSIELYEAKGGPWQLLNDSAIAVHASAAEGTITLNATSGIFSAGLVGSLFYLESKDVNTIPAWEVSKPITIGAERRSDRRTYEALNSATTGTSRPVHTEGALFDGDTGVQWQYRDAGYGYVKITGFTTIVPVTRAITGAVDSLSFALNEIRITSTAHGFTTGQAVTVTGVTGTVEANGTWFVEVIDANTFDLVGSKFSNVYVSGGTAASIPASRVTATVMQRLPSQVVGGINATTRWAYGEWSSVNGWPTDVCFYRERLWFGRGRQLWGSVSADFDDYSPKNFGDVTADMAITVQLVSGKINDIQWLAPDRDLVAGTAGGEFGVGELTNGEPLSPSNRRSRILSEFGSRAIPPIKNAESLLFIQRSGLKARETFYEFTSDGYKSTDTTVLAEHITATGVTQMVFAPDPDQIVWCTRTDGTLIGFTWNNEQNVRGWHRHPVGGDGIVESIGVIPAAEGDRSELWAVIKRTINGVTKRYVEYMERPYRKGDNQASQFYLDSGLTYTGSATTTISGLDHLEGEEVGVLVNGAPHPNVTVTGGEIQLQIAGTTVQVGLPKPARYRSMRMEAGSANGTAQGKTKRISRVIMRLLDTGAGTYGPLIEGGEMDDLLLRSGSDLMDQPVPLFSGDKVVAWPDGYTTDAYLGFEIVQPVAATIVAIMPQITTQDAR